MAGSRTAYTEPRKSFFQSLDPEERAALLKVAPSLKYVHFLPPLLPPISAHCCLCENAYDNISFFFGFECNPKP
jgi:hypothetical protein